MSSPEITLWRAVVLQQFIDAVTPAATSRQAYDRRIAQQWLLGDSEVFRIVCDLAALRPSLVRRRAEEIAATGWAHTKFNFSNGSQGILA